MYDVVIVGAGAAGLYAAKELIGLKVLVIEKNDKVGFKLSIAGKSQCNYTHSGDIKSFFEKYGPKKNFVKKALALHDNKEVINYFRSRGVDETVREDGKVFPSSMDSMDIVNSLVKDFGKHADLKMGERVKNIFRSEDGFDIETNKGSYKGRNVIISTGGASYPVTGSTGDGYRILERMGHTIIEPKPSLTPVFINGFPLVELSGISFLGAGMSIYRDNKKVHSFTGDVLITHKGFSGPLVIDNSRYFQDGDMLSFNFKGEKLEDVEKKIMKATDANGKKSVLSLYEVLDVPKRFMEVMCAYCSIDKEKKLSEFGKKDRRNLAASICDFRINDFKAGDFKIAMATAGGIDTSEVNSKTMESKLLSGLYIVGELLDVDGDSGGYNIQWAFSSAFAAALDIRNKSQNK